MPHSIRRRLSPSRVQSLRSLNLWALACLMPVAMISAASAKTHAFSKAGAAPNGPAVSLNSKLGDDTYTLRIEAKEASMANGADFVRFDYALQKNGKALLPEYRSGEVPGTLFGCHGVPNADSIQKLVQEARFDNQLLGWIIQAPECGNPGSHEVHVLSLRSDGSAYSVSTLHSKNALEMTGGGDGVDVWSSRQVHGDASGSAMSFIIPVAHQWNKTGFLTLALPTDYKTWHGVPTAELTFVTVYATGIREGNAEIMLVAVEQLFSDKDVATYRALGLPGSKSEAKSMADVVKQAAAKKIWFWRDQTATGK